ncbi:hypothetical protein E2P81_ATG05986 [Venturia nashicola]|nr:hypothetical protein E2P81_ATG05986 [Venturia nashicola]
MSHSDSDYHTTWTEAVELSRANFYALPDFYFMPIVATMAIALKDGVYSNLTRKIVTYNAFAAPKHSTLLWIGSHSDSSPLNCLFSLPPASLSACDTDSSSPTSSDEGAEFLFDWSESRKERRHANRELEKNTRLNHGMYKVKERLAIFREEEECGVCFCFGEDSDEEGEPDDENDGMDELMCESYESVEDEEVFDGDEGVESEDSDSLCGGGGGGEEEEDGSSVGQDEELGNDEIGDDGKTDADAERDEDEDSDEEMEDGSEKGKGRKRKARKSVSWKADDELTEIHIVKREELSMEYVFGQERATMRKEDGTSKFASKKASKEKAAATKPTTKMTTRGGSHRINSDDEAESYVFGQQRTDSAREESFGLSEQHTVLKEDEAKNNVDQSTKEEEVFVFGGRQSKIRKRGEHKHIATTTITVTEVQPDNVAKEPEEAFVFGKQPGVWRMSEDDMNTN